MLAPFRSAVLLAAFGTACVAVRLGDGGDELAASAALTGSAGGDVVSERATVSSALDRITKRTPELNGLATWAGDGRGVSIYVFDGGVDQSNPELAGRVRIGYDAFPSRPRVCNAHGTAVAGAAAGASLGVAPRAEIVDVKIINCATRRGTLDAIVAAARWTASDHRRHPFQPAVANWSFMVDTDKVFPSLDTAAKVLHDAGVLIVASAGNLDIDACRVAPANSRRTLVVGSSSVLRDELHHGIADYRTPETAWGRCIDIYAPGDSVLLPGADNGTSATSYWGGTSMSAGYVSGAAALVLERTPFASPDVVRAALEQRATPDAVDERTRPAARKGKLLYIGP
ncbi:MAG TPA: S8 family serine peptidase [Gemmatimonadaceae bacterium]|nr:S8 family serine peptidase [Gemmatimonadaceae bacterium]